MEFQRVSYSPAGQLRNAVEKRKKNGMWLSKSARNLKNFRSRCRTVSAELCLAVMLLTGCSSIPATFHPKHPLPPTEVTHELWHQVLENSVNNGDVNYPALQNEDRFGAFLGLPDRIDLKTLPNRNEQLALWINSYNAFAIQGILNGESPAPYLGWYYYFKSRRYSV